MFIKNKPKGSNRGSRHNGGSRKTSLGEFAERRGYRGGGFKKKSGGKKFKSNQIDLNLYTQEAVKPEPEETVNKGVSFEDLGLHSKILQEIHKRGFQSATEIQSRLIPQFLSGEDVIAVSQTGSGKTGAYLLPLLHKYIQDKQSAPSLILVPTRELAYQVEKELFDFGLKRFGLYSLVCIGGTSIGQQIRWAKKRNEFIIATPGRLRDLVDRGALDLSQIGTVILDEMDRMLDMGFVDEITEILKKLPEDKQSGFFSATVNKKVEPLLKKFSPNTAITKVDNPQASTFVDQSMVKVGRSDNKIEVLQDLLTQEQNKSLVFVATKSETERVVKDLQESGFDARFIHGDVPQSKRNRVIKDYQRKTEGVLVATDVAARGLDIKDITHVVNYDEPNTYDDYIHRIGRTGRAGKFGKAVTLVKR